MTATAQQTVVSTRLSPLLRLHLLVGGFANQVGWFFVLAGMFFFWVFFVLTGTVREFALRGEPAAARGRVTRSEGTKFSSESTSRGRVDPMTKIYATHYEFKVDGKTWTGVSYARGRRLKKGSRVTVEYHEGKPQYSRIERMNASILGYWGLVPLVFPLTGLGFVIYGLTRGLRAGRILSGGRPARGRVTDRESTRRRVNYRPVTKFTIAFKAQDGNTYTAVGRTHKPRLVDEAPNDVLVVYDPAAPDRAVVPVTLPGHPDMDQTCRLRPRYSLITFLVLLLPLGTVIIHTMMARLILGG